VAVLEKKHKTIGIGLERLFMDENSHELTLSQTKYAPLWYSQHMSKDENGDPRKTLKRNIKYLKIKEY
jgi:hypothetical protein